MRRSLRIVITLAIMAVFATGAYAFTAQVTVPDTNAGFGSDPDGIPNLEAYGVGYDVDETANPPAINAVTFWLSDNGMTDGSGDLNDSEVVVSVRLEPNGAWYSCTTPSGAQWNCDVGGAVTVTNATVLDILAHS